MRNQIISLIILIFCHTISIGQNDYETINLFDTLTKYSGRKFIGYHADFTECKKLDNDSLVLDILVFLNFYNDPPYTYLLEIKASNIDSLFKNEKVSIENNSNLISREFKFLHPDIGYGEKLIYEGYISMQRINKKNIEIEINLKIDDPEMKRLVIIEKKWRFRNKIFMK